jgi:uncharacterized protein YjlB
MNSTTKMNPTRKLRAPESFMFKDDGAVPNNPLLPLLIYRRAIDLAGTTDPEATVERVFAHNGWGHSIWRNGIYPYTHYHSMIHEVLGIARGRAKVRFGGPKGEEVDLSVGDVAVLPAGTGHQGVWASPDLVVIGGYPPDGTYNLCRGSKSEHAKALLTIPDVPAPTSDPAGGKGGTLLELWRAGA